ncbi:MAG: T9SS type A sorting domain-containing protein [Bacteroidetes bacterium]|nr:MAG: T9SS type A sorting domain-containing protein [Bacteroidota bacterium]
MKKALLISLIGIISFSQTSFGQLVQGRFPVSMTNKFDSESIPAFKLPALSNQKLKSLYQEQNELDAFKIKQYGHPINAEIDFFKAAQKVILRNGNAIYRFRIKSSNAVSLNLIFSRFSLAPGCELSLVAFDKSAFVGSYTSRNNNQAQVLGTDLINTDDLIIELYEPKSQEGLSKLVIGRAIHGFTSPQDLIEKSLNSSGSCNIDVNCPQGIGWELARNSVAMIMNSNGGFCSGSMVNNTSGELIPYFFTAKHCGVSPESWVYRFRWESPKNLADCSKTASSGNGPEHYNINGGVLRASYSGSDMMLIELNSAPEPDWEVVYAGWDRSPFPATSSACIHHPDGDIKKITISYNACEQGTYNGSTAPNGHWKAFWSDGVTQGGSSGSPLFNSKRRVVGQLSGGASGCLSSDQSDMYGKFNVSWTGGGSNQTRLSNWLDPQGKDVEFIDANVQNKMDPFLFPLIGGLEEPHCSSVAQTYVILVNGGTDTLTSATIQYGIDGSMNELNWTGNLGLFDADTIFLETLNTPDGDHTLSVIVSNPNGGVEDNNPGNNTIEKAFLAIPNGLNYQLIMNLDCYANETSWEVLNESGQVIHKSAPYNSQDQPYTVIHNLCLNPGCYDLRVKDNLGDGMTSDLCESGSFYLVEPLSGDTLTGLDPENADFGSLIVKSFCASSSGIESLSKEPKVKIQPNPAKEQFTILSEESQLLSITIQSISGKTVYQKSGIFQNSQSIENKLVSGCYYVHIETEIGQRVLKLMITK